SRGIGGRPALLDSSLTRRSGRPPFPLPLRFSRSPWLLVAEGTLLALGTRCRAGQAFGRNQGGGRRPGDIRPKAYPARQEAPTRSRPSRTTKNPPCGGFFVCMAAPDGFEPPNA